MAAVTTEKHGSVLVATANNPPVNALSADVRVGLDAAIKEAAADPEVTAVVIACAGRTFFAGADITEFGKPPVEPWLPELVDRIERSEKPVVAAIHGTALGGGLEVALGCHYRIAVPSAKLGTPEVKLGLLPGAGGTQRLPRLANVELALKLVTSGNPIGAKEGQAAGLIDRLASEDGLLDEAIAFAREVADSRPLPRARDKTASAEPGQFDAFRQANARAFRNQHAPENNIKAVEAAVSLPFDEGMAKERELFMQLMFGTQSAALRHIFFAERKAAKIDGIDDDITLRPINRVGIIGAGTMGGGIAMNFLTAGIPVTIVEMQAEALERGTGTIRKNYEATAAKGRMSAEQVAGAMGALSPTLDFDKLAECDLIIEAVYESMEVKKEVFTRLDKIAKPGAILASNTSYLDINEIAAVTSRPQDVLGMHFFSPANVMKLLEIVRGDKTADDVLATAMALAKTIKKVAVVAGVAYGFIGNRMLMPRQVEAMKLLMEGATPEQVDRVHTEFGMPMGPFQMSDLAGVDIGWHRDPARIENVRDALCSAGRWGQKTGKGFYDYDEKRRPTASAEVQSIIDEFSARSGSVKREVTDEEILERTVYPMINEGALILAEGKAQRASDIDVVWIYGYGFPPYKGGPMFWADQEGLGKIAAGLEKHGFEVAPLLREKADANGRFNK
ncbi:3-hydroxyacyl-CoA dehydrogenase [Sphingomonas jejuensis]|uniref:3-hydroxyacyl-CoA dehydrogenase n=1 Tax=Sphingomonas jejuensis TaxID=904715 RepID=A0ABX0XI08_9SPHN|nr:3-hydroxyacyl-CoA dehydrogenase NAD-binding domain-containing protein [Sphingomonas jejuensis]NJC32968.1 3-hydroxyacyl-CoA dehydrogenase [Sphingomonas jejuensis]